MAVRLNRRNFLRNAAGLFVPAIVGIAKADIFYGQINKFASAGGGGNGLLSSLTAVYEMEQANNSNAPDATGNGKTLTVSGSTTQSNTHIQGSFSNHGSGSSSWTINDAAFNTSGNFSWYGWLQAPADGDFIVSRWTTGTPAWALYYDGSGALAGGANHYKMVVRNTANTSNFIASSTVSVPGASAVWHMVVVTWNSSTTVASISVDAETFVTTGTTNALNAATQNWQLGLAAALIDENALWGGRVLGQGNATTLYAVGSGFFFSGGLWS